MSSKFKVCTYYIKFDNSSKIYEDIYNLSTKINKKYCELNGYDYTNCLFNESVLKNFLDDDFFKIEKKWAKACVYKYKYLLDVLNTSENDGELFLQILTSSSVGQTNPSFKICCVNTLEPL